MEDGSWYPTLRVLHAMLAVLSIGGFIVRGVWMLVDSPLRALRLVRIAPHVVDSLLLLAGIGLAVASRQYPFVAPWLTAKLLALFAYIGLGLVALRFGRSRPLRALAFAGAIAVFGYMLAVAFTRDPVPWR